MSNDDRQPLPSPFTTEAPDPDAPPQPVMYPLGPNLLQLAGNPIDLFDAGFRAVDPETGRPLGNLRDMILALWSAASVSAIDQAQITHRHDCRISAMERVLQKHRPDLHEEYLAEVELVQQELLEQAKAAMSGHPAPAQAPEDSIPGT